ncbi:hypothetical protein O181_009311 [Austropuccinia psidii MF-1]|uniref:Reverse transcriptase domain-containing protein n=1 Tax=Austropuccinia psidii MF-1 TaxID=1389203 RepID=A0A9Q3BRL2_9BASI|nr:hypothetical protein [Austropuccinia psidii MF-1]
MEITLELDDRYLEGQKEKGIHQDKKPPISGSNSSKPSQSASSKKPYPRENKKGKNFQVSKDQPHVALLTKENKLIGSEKERRIKEGLCTYCGGEHPIEKCFKRPENRKGSSRGFPRKQVKVEKLPTHHACDHHIKLEGLLPPVGVIYSFSKHESETLRSYISENVEKGFIRPGSSSTGAPVFFVKKKDGGLCLCVDYLKINAVTRKNRYPVPPMNQLLTVFSSSTIFSKIDLCGAYNILRIKEGDEHLTAFRTKYGSYRYLVIPFGLTNAPASFQNHVNDIFADFLDFFFVVYVYDIMVFSSSVEEHVKHVASVLQRLRDNNLFAKASNKSSLGLSQRTSRHFKLSLAFPTSIIVSLKVFQKISALTSLLKKDSPFIFIEEALSQFQILKEAFTTAPILSHFNPSLPSLLETDASDYELGAVLSQVNDSGKPPIEFDSRKLLPAELNYEIHDKELLAMVWALKHWRVFLLSLYYSFKVLKDHSSLQYFMSSKVLMHRQSCWGEFLSEFHFSITYHQGRLATLPDALSRWGSVYP